MWHREGGGPGVCGKGWGEAALAGSICSAWERGGHPRPAPESQGTRERAAVMLPRALQTQAQAPGAAAASLPD